MALPAKPVRQYSFTDFQTNNPTAPPPGDRMDAEYDRADGAIAEVIDFVSVSLNTDGTIRSQTVGQAQLVPGLFDQVANDAIAEVEPLVNEAQSYSASAGASASHAQSSASAAATSQGSASASAQAAAVSATAADTSRSQAQGYAGTAQAAAATAQTSANHTDGNEAVCQKYADVTMAWAEHMPDTLPADTLAVMGITGDHWSSRWWANQASQNVSTALDDINKAVNQRRRRCHQ